MTDPYASDRIREAAALLRHRASRATPGPWRLSSGAPGSRYAALVADVPHPSRVNPDTGGWAWDEGYGGCLIAESMMTGDRIYFATMQPQVGPAIADLLDLAAAATPVPGPAVLLADIVLGVVPATHDGGAS